MPTAGYSGTPLVKKLGFKAGAVLRVINAPQQYPQLLTGLPEGITWTNEQKIPRNGIHLFTTTTAELYRLLPELRKEIVPDGMIWVSWPKKTSKVPTDITENTIRTCALSIGLVDIKVCAVDETWSGLKLVIPVKDRPGRT